MKEKVKDIKELIGWFVAIVLIMIFYFINAVTQLFVWHHTVVGIIITVASIVCVVLAVIYWKTMTEFIESIIAGNCNICENHHYDLDYGCKVCYCEDAKEIMARNERIKEQVEEILKRELGKDNISIHVNLD